MKIFKVLLTHGRFKYFLDKAAADNYLLGTRGALTLESNWINAENIEGTLAMLASQSNNKF